MVDEIHIQPFFIFVLTIVQIQSGFYNDDFYNDVESYNTHNAVDDVHDIHDAGADDAHHRLPQR